MSIIFDVLISLLLLLAFPSNIFAAISFIVDSATPSGNEVVMSASVSGLTSSSCSFESKCFLQAVLKPVGGSRYFGQTQNLINNWIDYQSSPELEFLQSSFYSFTPESGSWSGIVKMRFFPDDENYAGPGNYEIKLRRFSGKSSNPAGDSNVLTISLSPTIPTPSPTPTAASTPTSTPTPTSTFLPTNTPTKSPTPPPTQKITPNRSTEVLSPAESRTSFGDSQSGSTATPAFEIEAESLTVLGASVSASPSAEIPKVMPKTNYLYIAMAILAGGISLGSLSLLLSRLLQNRA